MAYYTGLPDAAAFEGLFTFLGASNETILSCRQVEAGERPRSVGGGPKKESVFPLRELLFVTLMRLRRDLEEEVLADMLHVSQSAISRLLSTWIRY